jgi:hypothetical protein
MPSSSPTTTTTEKATEIPIGAPVEATTPATEAPDSNNQNSESQEQSPPSSSSEDTQLQYIWIAAASVSGLCAIGALAALVYSRRLRAHRLAYANRKSGLGDDDDLLSDTGSRNSPEDGGNIDEISVFSGSIYTTQTDFPDEIKLANYEKSEL